VNAFLVEHPSGLCLFDTGQSARATQRGYFPRWHPFFRLARFELTAADEIVEQLRTIEIEPRDIRWVVLSHLHTDHIGGLEPFRRSEVVVSQVEWKRAQGLGGRLRGYLPQHWPSGLEPTRLDLDVGGFGPFPAVHDLAGDHTLLVVAAPGHTPGHMGLLVGTSEGAVLLSGDMSHVPDTATSEAIEAYCADRSISVVGAHDDCPATMLWR
jgi:glyoxylase-like metal-dependent hydrolase (beta-lactamase superfamily II)